MEDLSKLKKAELIKLLEDKEFEIGALRSEVTILRAGLDKAEDKNI